MNLSRSRREARSHELVELRGGMRRIGATCTAAQAYTRCKDMPISEYDRNGGGIRRRRRVPVGMASLASQRPTARVAGSGSAELRLLTCDRRYQHSISAKLCAVFGPDERQAPIIHLGDQIGRAQGGRRVAEWKVIENDVNGQRCRSEQCSRRESGWAGRTSYLPKAAAASVRRGSLTRPRLRTEPQDV